MLNDLRKRASRVGSIAARWDEVIDFLERLRDDDESEALDLAPTLVEIHALTREARIRATVYPPTLFSPDGALVNEARALEYLTTKGESLRKTAAGLDPSPDYLSARDAECALREIAAAVAVLLNESGDVNV